MPTPDDDGHVQGIDYGYTGDLTHIHEALSEASRIADGMGE